MIVKSLSLLVVQVVNVLPLLIECSKLSLSFMLTAVFTVFQCVSINVVLKLHRTCTDYLEPIFGVTCVPFDQIYNPSEQNASTFTDFTQILNK